MALYRFKSRETGDLVMLQPHGQRILEILGKDPQAPGIIRPEEMASFEQCFLTGTAAEVTPVSEIGPYLFSVGDITRTLMEDYSAEVQPKAPVELRQARAAAR